MLSSEQQDRIGCWQGLLENVRQQAYLGNISNREFPLRMARHRHFGTAVSIEDKHIESLKYSGVRQAISSISSYDAEMLSGLVQGVFHGLDAAVQAAEQRRADIAAGRSPQIRTMVGDSSKPGFNPDLDTLGLQNFEERKYPQAMHYLREIFLAGLFHLAEENKEGNPMPCVSAPVLLQPSMRGFLELVVYPAFRKQVEAQIQARAVV